MKTSIMLFLAVILTVGMACKSTKESTNSKSETAANIETTKINNSTTRNAASNEKERAIDPIPLRITNDFQSTTKATAPIIIYKTKQNYSKQVPVGLDETKTKIISYPGQKDVSPGQLPTELLFGFLLDNRGLTPNSAFLKYDYDQYSRLETMPSLEELFNDIIDADPFIEMYFCGTQSDFQDDVVNTLNKQLTECNGNPKNIYKKLK